MLKKSLLILVTGTVFFSCRPLEGEKKPVWDSNLSVEENVAAQALAFDNDSTFPFLDDIMKNRSVLFLGEAGHNDTTTTQIKVNMISYLNDKDVHSVLFEITPFISSYVFSCPEYDNFTKEWKIQDIFPMWFGHQPFQSLLERIGNHKIKAYGIDCCGGYYDIEAVKLILNKYLDEHLFFLDWNKLQKYYIESVYSQRKIPEKEQFEMMQMIDSISIYTQYLINKTGKNMDLESLIQWQRNINTMFSYNLYVVPYE
ncbi:MAG: hypothetical protein LBF08_06430, partial [Dysgonamonadaceae bacterium]|nr:hypothetical protein [Dysgonamonadaceae bacterium]